jgi:peptidoglycan/LPS O-acetylase OafA/YrhL
MHPARKSLWAFAFLLAIIVAWIGFHSQPAAWAMYIQIPGIVIGLVCGWIYDRATHGDSPFNPAILVAGLTILLNAYVYSDSQPASFLPHEVSEITRIVTDGLGYSRGSDAGGHCNTTTFPSA